MARKCARVLYQSKFLNTYHLAADLTCPRALPQRTGSHPVDHAITSFNHVRLPKSSLLGSPAESKNDRDDFISIIHRVAVGTLFLSAVVIPALKLVTFNATRFSQQRLVSGQDGKPMAVIGFRTQCLPILHAVAQYSVLEPFLVSAAIAFRDTGIDPRVRHGIATAFKAVALGHFENSVRAMNENCGWQGHFEHNQILQLEVSKSYSFLIKQRYYLMESSSWRFAAFPLQKATSGSSPFVSTPNTLSNT